MPLIKLINLPLIKLPLILLMLFLIEKSWLYAGVQHEVAMCLQHRRIKSHSLIDPPSCLLTLCFIMRYLKFTGSYFKIHNSLFLTLLTLLYNRSQKPMFSINLKSCTLWSTIFVHGSHHSMLYFCVFNCVRFHPNWDHVIFVFPCMLHLAWCSPDKNTYCYLFRSVFV